MSTATNILDIVHIETGLDPAAIVKVSQVIHTSEDCTCAELGSCLWTLFVEPPEPWFSTELWSK